ncbi:hypothetical protein HNP48_001700 [Acidovorax soli]|uniref:Uncharacterized protein n=1 Tax=Acidovorax soli TaxID=592050 RepID=A0A7X0U8D7_9BURK|nr:hypothetical protein [Acidovorax soli]MBB6559036.1 hypothetical protein [Acidovorax soli]
MHLTTTHLHDLLLDPATHPRGQPHLSAASGLVRAGAWLYVVADDEHHLGMLPITAAVAPQPAPLVQLHRILPGDLPTEPRERKKRKPDLEALALLPASSAYPHGALLALGSGSKPNRQRGLAIALDATGRPDGAAQALDLSALYAPLRAEFADLNIEGAFVTHDAMHLLQRGNKGDARSACITYPLAPLLAWLAGTRAQPPAPLRTTLFDLGTVDGVPLGFTDGAALPGGDGDCGWIFSAVAENTDDSYADGECVASAIGWVEADGVLQRIAALEGAPKVEGIALDGAGRLLMVTDADDPARASRLLAVALD